MNPALTLLAGLVLEDGRRWGEVATAPGSGRRDSTGPDVLGAGSSAAYISQTTAGPGRQRALTVSRLRQVQYRSHLNAAGDSRSQTQSQ